MIYYDRKYFGEKLHGLRTERGLTRQQLAFKLDVTDCTIANYENGITLPGIEIFHAICNYFKVSQEYFLKYEV